MEFKQTDLILQHKDLKHLTIINTSIELTQNVKIISTYIFYSDCDRDLSTWLCLRRLMIKN